MTQLPTFIGSGANSGWSFNVAIAIGLLVGAVIAIVLLVRYGRAKGVSNRMHELFPTGIVLTARSSDELQAALEQLDGFASGDVLTVPRFVTVVVDDEGIAFWVPMPFRDQATLDDRRLRLIPWARVRTIEAGTAFVERPTNSVVVVAAQAGRDVRVEFVPHQTGFFGGMGYDEPELRVLIDELRAKRPGHGRVRREAGTWRGAALLGGSRDHSVRASCQRHPTAERQARPDRAARALVRATRSNLLGDCPSLVPHPNPGRCDQIWAGAPARIRRFGPETKEHTPKGRRIGPDSAHSVLSPAELAQYCAG